MNSTKTLLALAATAALGATTASNASAAVTWESGSVQVEKPANGSITGDGVDCGTDCVGDYRWNEADAPPVKTFTAHPDPGFTVTGWTGCDVASGATCEVSPSSFEPRRIAATIKDVTKPSVAMPDLADGATVGGPADVYVKVTASDPSGVRSAHLVVDGTRWVAVGTPVSGFAALSASDLPEGRRTLYAVATDRSGNTATTRSVTVNVDRTAPALEWGLVSVDEGEVADLTVFEATFRRGDATAVDCDVHRRGDPVRTWPCTSPTTLRTTSLDEGPWVAEVSGRDAVGNLTRIKRAFTIDRTAPVPTLGGLAEGAQVAAGAKLRLSVGQTDANPKQTRCTLDGAAVGLCAGDVVLSAPSTPGEHVLVVEAEDRAGHTAQLRRTFRVAAAPGEAVGSGSGAPGAGSIAGASSTEDAAATSASASSGGANPVTTAVARGSLAPRAIVRLKRLGAKRGTVKLEVRCSAACSSRVFLTTRKGKPVGALRKVVLAKAGRKVVVLKVPRSARGPLVATAMTGRSRAVLRLAA